MDSSKVKQTFLPQDSDPCSPHKPDVIWKMFLVICALDGEFIFREEVAQNMDFKVPEPMLLKKNYFWVEIDDGYMVASS